MLGREAERAGTARDDLDRLITASRSDRLPLFGRSLRYLSA